jgi:hypothetical protein
MSCAAPQNTEQFLRGGSQFSPPGSSRWFNGFCTTRPRQASGTQRVSGPGAKGATWNYCHKTRSPARQARVVDVDSGTLSSTALKCSLAVHVRFVRRWRQARASAPRLMNDPGWCIENPVRGAHLEPNGPTMRALEAYIQAQRKGVPMNYGKH